MKPLHVLIREARKREGLSQEDLARQTKTAAKTIYRLERGERVRDDIQRAVCHVLRIEAPTAPIEDTASPIQIIGDPALCADPGTGQLIVSLREEPHVGILARIDNRAWRGSVAAKPFVQRLRMDQGCRDLLKMDLFTLLVSGLILLYVVGSFGGHDLLLSWSGLVSLTATVGIIGGMAAFVGRMHRNYWQCIDDDVHALAFGGDEIVFLHHGPDSVSMRRLNLMGRYTKETLHEGFATYRIYSDSTGSLTHCLDGLPQDPEIARFMGQMRSSKQIKSVPIQGLTSAT